MKKSLICILLVFFSFYLTGCTQLNSNSISKTAQPVKKVRQIQEKDPSAAYYYLKSRIHSKNLQYDKSMISLKKALSKDPDSFILNWELIGLHLRSNNRAKAIELSEKLTQTHPDNVDGLLLLVQLKKETFDEKKLVAILNRILLLNPEDKETFIRLGKIYIENENNIDARDLFKKMTVQFPDYYVAWFYLGQACMNEKDYDLAKKHFLKTIKLEPDLIEPRFQLIKIYQSNNTKANKQKILPTYNDILKIEPENPQALIGKALYFYKNHQRKKAQNIFMELGQDVDSSSRLVMVAFDEYISEKEYEDAVIIFSQILKADPENSTLNFFTGMSYESLENPTKAISHYLKVRPDHTQYKQSLLKIAYLYKDLKQNQKATEFLEDKYKQFPKNIDIISYLASFYESDGLHDKAIALLEKGLADTPQSTSLLFKLGSVQDKAGHKNQSIVTMKKVLQIDPKDANALNYLGYTYAEMGIKLDTALALLEEAYQLRPDDGYIIDSLGWIHFKRGEYEKAVTYLKKAAELTSYETIIADHLGDAYQKANGLKEALNTYKKAISNATEEDKEKVVEVKSKIEAIKKLINE